MSSNEHPDRQIEEDVLAVPFITWLGIVGVILIVASVFALTGMYYQTQRSLDAQRYADAEAVVTPLEAKVAADDEVVDGYYRVPSPNGTSEEGADAKKFVSIPVSEGKAKVIERYAR